MRFVGIDVAAERHVVAIVDEAETVRLKPTAFTEDAEGYQNLWSLLGPPSVDTSKPAIRGRGKSGHRRQRPSACVVARLLGREQDTFFRGTPGAAPAEIVALRAKARRVIDIITLPRPPARRGGACASCGGRT